jgi:hypothetical protein
MIKIKRGQCVICDEIFLTKSKKVPATCSKTCRSAKLKQTWKKKTKEEIAQITAKNKKTNLERYGKDNYFKTEEFQEKSKKSLISKYGSLEEYRRHQVKESKKTCLQKYETTSYNKTKKGKDQIKSSWSAKTKEELAEVINKRKQTLISKHGSLEKAYEQTGKRCAEAWAPKSKEEVVQIIETRKQTLISKHGSLERAYSESVNKSKEVCLERYGVDNGSKTESAKQKISSAYNSKTELAKTLIQDKAKQTLTSNYGSLEEAYSQIAIKGKQTRDLSRDQLFATAKTKIKTISKTLDRPLTFVESQQTSGLSEGMINKLLRQQPNLPIKKYQSSYNSFFYDFLVSANIENFDREAHIYGNKQRADFYLTSIKLGIEINPYPYHITLGKTYSSGRLIAYKPKLYHYNKTFLAKQQNIELIHLYDWDLNSETKLNDLLSYIKQKLTNNLPPILPLQSKEPKLHWYKPKTDSHMIDKNFNKNTMIKLGYLGIYDDGTNSKPF